MMKINVGPVEVELNPEGDRVCAHVAKHGAFESRSLEIWAELCAKGGYVIDGGAYCGLFAIAAAKMSCKVFAFEPMPRNFQRTRENMRANGVEPMVSLYKTALSDTDGSADIVFNNRMQDLTSGASLVRTKKHFGRLRDDNRAGVETVQTMKVDTFFAYSNLTAIKLDVERAEPAALRGARETIARCKPALLVEVLDEQREREVWEAIDGLGYKLAENDGERNWLLLPA